VAQSVYCDICQITCNTQEIYNNHVSGKKHNKNNRNRTADDRPIKFVPARSGSPGTEAPYTNNGVKNVIHCDMCKVTCNTLEMYNNHVAGKKHNRKIMNLTLDDKPIQSVPATNTLRGTQTPTTNDNDQEHVPSSSQMEPKLKKKEEQECIKRGS
jgi:zinc finger RNA-binding protein